MRRWEMRGGGGEREDKEGEMSECGLLLEWEVVAKEGRRCEQEIRKGGD